MGEQASPHPAGSMLVGAFVVALGTWFSIALVSMLLLAVFQTVLEKASSIHLLSNLVGMVLMDPYLFLPFAIPVSLLVARRFGRAYDGSLTRGVWLKTSALAIAILALVSCAIRIFLNYAFAR